MFLFCLSWFLGLCIINEVTTWPRMDNDPPGSWNGVVQTPLRKLWVQCQRVATSMSKVQDLLVGYPRAPFASVVTVCPRDPPSRLTLARLSAAYSLRVLASGVRAYAGTEGRSGALPGGGLETPSGTPQKGGSGTPQKGGCRDTKQCKFWRVSSVLIQGAFCFWGVRGGSGGVPGGSFLGVPWGPCKVPSDPQKWTSGALPLTHPSGTKSQDADVVQVPAVPWQATGCWRA